MAILEGLPSVLKTAIEPLLLGMGAGTVVIGLWLAVKAAISMIVAEKHKARVEVEVYEFFLFCKNCVSHRWVAIPLGMSVNDYLEQKPPPLCPHCKVPALWTSGLSIAKYGSKRQA